MPTGNVVITGASTGIGRATALHLDTQGYTVFAGVRGDAAGEELRSAASDRLTPLRIDITDDESIKAAAQQVQAAGPALAGLVNNAGVVVAGPIEYLPLEELRRQLEVNLIGHVAMTQAMLPLLRAGRGRIVNLSSIGGRLANPFIGAYVASKFALEGLSDSLRRELRPLGVKVSVVEPGSVATEIWRKGDEEAEQVLDRIPPEGLQVYGEGIAAAQKAASQLAQQAISPEEVAKVIAHALSAGRPKTRYVVGRDARIQASSPLCCPTAPWMR